MDVNGAALISPGPHLSLLECEHGYEPNETDHRWELLPACEVQEGVFGYCATSSPGTNPEAGKVAGAPC